MGGTYFWPAIIGFVLSGVGIAVLALIIGALNPKGYENEISSKISPQFATIYLVVLYLSIGPFFAISRTATVSYEIGIAPILGAHLNEVGLILFTLLYFAAYLIALNPSKILDRIGRVLTPVFSHINDELNSSPAVRTNVATSACSGRDCCRYHAPFV